MILCWTHDVTEFPFSFQLFISFPSSVDVEHFSVHILYSLAQHRPSVYLLISIKVWWTPCGKLNHKLKQLLNKSRKIQDDAGWISKKIKIKYCHVTFYCKKDYILFLSYSKLCDPFNSCQMMIMFLLYVVQLKSLYSGNFAPWLEIWTLNFGEYFFIKILPSMTKKLKEWSVLEKFIFISLNRLSSFRIMIHFLWETRNFCPNVWNYLFKQRKFFRPSRWKKIIFHLHFFVGCSVEQP